MNEERDLAYQQGSRNAHMATLQYVLGQIRAHGGVDVASAEEWRIERGEAVAILRELCNAFGDNDWEEGLQLSDIIEKHLAYYLHLNASGTDNELLRLAGPVCPHDGKRAVEHHLANYIPFGKERPWSEPLAIGDHERPPRDVHPLWIKGIAWLRERENPA